jgi:hypothetical protein
MNRKALLIAILEAEMEVEESFTKVMTEMENGTTIQESDTAVLVPDAAGVGAPAPAVSPVRPPGG